MPGNHDVDRRKVLQAEKEWLNNERHGLDEIEEALNAGSPDSKQWMSRLEAYRSFLNSYGLTHLSPESPSLIWQHRWHGKEMTVKISGLNSAWSCCDKKEKGSLRMGGKWQSSSIRLHENNDDLSIVLIHHPSSWLHESEDPDFRRYLENHSDLQLHGHEHSQFITPLANGKITISAGACYDRRGRQKGFSYGSIDSNRTGFVWLREWDETGSGWVRKSIAGLAPLGEYKININNPRAHSVVDGNTSNNSNFMRANVLAKLQRYFESAATCYSSYTGAWVERTFSTVAESISKNETYPLFAITDICDSSDDIIIHAPVNFGLTCVGRRIALQIFKHKENDFYLYLRMDFKPHAEAVQEAIQIQLDEIGMPLEKITGIILDGVSYDKRTRRALRSIRSLNEKWRIIALHTRDDMADLTVIGESDVFDEFKTWHLWSLNRKDVRALVGKCISDHHVLAEEVLTEKIISDIDALNLPRTPLNCLTLLKTSENQVDDTPVNRTEMIKRVLSLFFNQFNTIPRYSERPDLVDCEYTLGKFAEILIRRQDYQFSKNEFILLSTQFADSQKLPLEVDVLFMFLATERIIVLRGGKFEFRFAYWLHYFAAHRMHHSIEFKTFMLDEGRYIYFPEIIEFYSGIDRRREDAVSIAIRDIKKLNDDFSVRSGISEGFNPYNSAEWNPSGKYLESVSEEIEDEAQQSALPQEVKDAIADSTYDRTKAYRQEVQAFIKESTLPELVSAAKGAARTLRNSDYVDPLLKRELLDQVMRSWEKVSQALLVISPILATHGSASFEGMGFKLSGFNEIPDDQKLFAIADAIPYNVVNWFEEDLHSKKLGLLCLEMFAEKKMTIASILLRRTVIIHKPKNWEEGVEKFLAREPKNSFYLYDVFRSLRAEFEFGSKSVIATCKRLAAFAVAKHWTDRPKPNQKTIAEALRKLEAGQKQHDD